MIMYVGHLLSLLIYVAIIATTVNCYISMQKVYFGHTLTIVLYTFIVSLFCQASAFLMLQIDWITMDYNDAIGDLTALGWLAFDYFNGFALLSFATATNIYLKWRKNMDEHSEFHYRRRLEDFPP
jgi:hypothetical protein